MPPVRLPASIRRDAESASFPTRTLAPNRRHRQPTTTCMREQRGSLCLLTTDGTDPCHPCARLHPAHRSRESTRGHPPPSYHGQHRPVPPVRLSAPEGPQAKAVTSLPTLARGKRRPTLSSPRSMEYHGVLQGTPQPRRTPQFSYEPAIRPTSYQQQPKPLPARPTAADPGWMHLD